MRIVKKTKNAKILSLGSGKSYNIQTLYPEIDFTKLTSSNFIVECAGGHASTNNSASNNNIIYVDTYYSISKNYDNTTGILTLSASLSCNAFNWNTNVTNKGNVNLETNTFLYIPVEE